MKVVLLHALPLDERMWAMQQDVLEEHEVFAPNLYRLGRSMDAWADGVLRIVDGRFAAVGASMGGYCALAIARRAPERLAGVVLAGSRAGADSPERRAAREESIRLVRDGGAEALWEDMRVKLLSEEAPAQAVERAEGIALEQEQDGLVAAIEAIRDRSDSLDVISSLPCPLLVVVGDRDPFLPVDEAREIAEAAPDGRLLVVEATGHLLSLERPRDFNVALAEFLAELP